MFRKTKKILALILAVIMACCALPMGAIAAEAEANPVIYILGYGGVLRANVNDYKSEQIYPISVDIEAIVKEAAVPCLTALGAATLSGDYSKYCDEIYNRMAPVYEDFALGKNGRPVVDENGNYSGSKYTGANKATTNFTHFKGGEYCYYYDWRLSPYDLMEEFSYVIDQASKFAGGKKVDLVGRCYGANLISTYLATNPDANEKIDDVIMYVPSTEGIGLIGRLFSGDIELNSDSINEFINAFALYSNIEQDDLLENPFAEALNDGFVQEFLDVMLLILEQAEMLNISAEKLQQIVDGIKDNLIPRLLRSSYATFPAFWAMVPDEYFEKAVNFVFSTDELKEEYSDLIELIYMYHDEVQINSRKTLKEHAEKGLDIHVVSKYNLPSVPLFGNSNPMSDLIAETTLTSFGATTSEFGKTLGADYISAMTEESKKYLSADEKIDASTCLFPEKTWFIKNCRHDHFEAVALYNFLDALLCSEEPATIETYEEYPQFIDAAVTAEALTPVTEKDAEIPEKGSDDARFQMLFKFIMVLLQAITKIFKGELSFSDLGSMLK